MGHDARLQGTLCHAQGIWGPGVFYFLLLQLPPPCVSAMQAGTAQCEDFWKGSMFYMLIQWAMSIVFFSMTWHTQQNT
jgi:hypothetical protein